MRNFLQFIIPLLVVVVAGFFLFMSTDPISADKKLYIKCNGNSEKYDVHSGIEINFRPDDKDCKLKIEVTNVVDGYVRLKTPFLWRLTLQGEFDETEARKINVIEDLGEVVLYSFDRKTKYIFEYK